MAADSHLMGAQLGWNQPGEEVLKSETPSHTHLMSAQLGWKPEMPSQRHLMSAQLGMRLPRSF